LFAAKTSHAARKPVTKASTSRRIRSDCCDSGCVEATICVEATDERSAAASAPAMFSVTACDPFDAF